MVLTPQASTDLALASQARATRARRFTAWLGKVLVFVVAVILDVSPGWSIARSGSGTGVSFGLVLAVVTAVYLVLLTRRRHPVAAFLVVWLFSWAGLVLPGVRLVAGPLVALHAVATRRSLGTARIALVATCLPFAADAYHDAGHPVSGDITGRESWVGQFAFYLVLAVAAWGVGRLAAAASARAVRDQVAAAVQAERAERLRLARELHDAVASSVSSMLLQAAGAQPFLARDADERVNRALVSIEHTAQQAMDELRRMLGLLRTDHDGTVAADGRRPSLASLPVLVESARESGLDASLRTPDEDPGVSPDIDLTAYRIVQEAVHNAQKYAGPDAKVEVEVHHDDVRLLVRVLSTPGVTVHPPLPASLSSGQGLRGLAERVELVGGTFAAGRSGDGFLVVAELPLEPVPCSAVRSTAVPVSGT